MASRMPEDEAELVLNLDGHGTMLRNGKCERPEVSGVPVSQTPFW